MILNNDALETIKSLPDTSIDLIFCDPPYMLGSQVIIKPDGKPDYKKAKDFMDRWDGLGGEYWEQFYAEVMRVLKYGGRCLMYSIDRQNFLFKYYATLSGLETTQSLYWYFVSNLPKSAPLGKLLDKSAKAERELIHVRTDGRYGYSLTNDVSGSTDFGNREKARYITAPATDLAKKYDGYKYSIAPLKQVCEGIMVFKKPPKNGSVLHDVIELNNGDESITCSALDIEGGRFGHMGKPRVSGAKATKNNQKGLYNTLNAYPYSKPYQLPDGRYPTQTFVDTQTAELLNNQSKNCSFNVDKCDYDTEHAEILHFSPKVQLNERHGGFTYPDGQPIRDGAYRAEFDGIDYLKNAHPTLKPIQLNKKILTMFKTPDKQRIFIPFSGAGSEIIGALKAGYTDIIACEINPEYCAIAEQRIKYHTTDVDENLSIFEL